MMFLEVFSSLVRWELPSVRPKLSFPVMEKHTPPYGAHCGYDLCAEISTKRADRVQQKTLSYAGI